MLQILAATLYVSFLCWMCGHVTIRAFRLLARQAAALPHFSIVCMAGLSTLAVAAGILSLFVPLGATVLQAALLLGALLGWTLQKKIRADAKETFRQIALHHTRPSIALLAASILLVLIMGSWSITHPDTLGYHAQLIQWAGQYRVIPGLVHVHVRYGLQSYWYLLCALFSFPFLHSPALTFVNTSVLCWYLLFATEKISTALRSGKSGGHGMLTGFLFLPLLIINFIDFGQLRLTAVSASPDFIAGVYCWLVLYLLATGGGERISSLLVFFFSIVAVTIKLSCAPVLMIAGYELYRSLKDKKFKPFILLTGFSLLAIGPFAVRNAVTSGYIAFPSTFPDMVQADWKLDKIHTQQVKDYVTAYAKIGAGANMGAPAPAITRHVTGWLPVWWRNRSGAEKALLAALCTCLLLALVFARKLIGLTGRQEKLALSVCATGIVFWFLEAPDPRFAYGFIMPLMGLILYKTAGSSRISPRLAAGMLQICVWVLAAALTAYSAYRFNRFFHAKDLIVPEGIAAIACKKINLQGIGFLIPYDDCDCGGTRVPCAYTNETFRLRGKQLTDGFNSRTAPVK